MLGAQLSLEILREIVTVLKSHFIKEKLPIIRIMNGIITNDAMVIISVMMNDEDKLGKSYFFFFFFIYAQIILNNFFFS